MKILLDTSFIIELRRGNELAKSTLKREAKNATDIVISALSLYELYVGAFYTVFKKKNFREILWLEEFLKWVKVCHLEEETVKVAAEIKASAMADGLILPDVDLLIALSAGPKTKILTCDEDHLKMKKYLEKHGVEVIFVKRQ